MQSRLSVTCSGWNFGRKIHRGAAVENGPPSHPRLPPRGPCNVKATLVGGAGRGRAPGSPAPPQPRLCLLRSAGIPSTAGSRPSLPLGPHVRTRALSQGLEGLRGRAEGRRVADRGSSPPRCAPSIAPGLFVLFSSPQRPPRPQSARSQRWARSGSRCRSARPPRAPARPRLGPASLSYSSSCGC